MGLSTTTTDVVILESPSSQEVMYNHAGWNIQEEHDVQFCPEHSPQPLIKATSAMYNAQLEHLPFQNKSSTLVAASTS